MSDSITVDTARLPLLLGELRLPTIGKLWQSFTERAELVEAGAIALGLGAFALLLALTAVLIIRLGHVWEDARSLLLLVVLMLMNSYPYLQS